MARLFADYPKAVARSVEIAGRITFNLEELRYEVLRRAGGPGKRREAYLEELAGHSRPSDIQNVCRTRSKGAVVRERNSP